MSHSSALSSPLSRYSEERYSPSRHSRNEFTTKPIFGVCNSFGKASLKHNLLIPVDEHEFVIRDDKVPKVSHHRNIEQSGVSLTINAAPPRDQGTSGWVQRMMNSLTPAVLAGVSVVVMEEYPQGVSYLVSSPEDFFGPLRRAFAKPSGVAESLRKHSNTTASEHLPEVSTTDKARAALASSVLPHTLAVKKRRDSRPQRWGMGSFVKELILAQVPGLYRLIVETEEVDDLRGILEALTKNQTLEEVSLPPTKISLDDETLDLLQKVRERVRFVKRETLTCERKIKPPATWEKFLLDQTPSLEGLVTEAVPTTRMKRGWDDEEGCGQKEEEVMSFRFASGRWKITKPESQYCCKIKSVLEDAGLSAGAADISLKQEGDLPDAGLMKPTPSEEAVVLVRHFLKYYVSAEMHLSFLSGKSSEGETIPASSESSRWNPHFEAFFQNHIAPPSAAGCSATQQQVSSSSSSSSCSEREVTQQCWLLGELWGISCYLDIPTL